MLSKYEIIEQPIWGNEYFRIKDICLFYKRWTTSNILYVKDLVRADGEIKSDYDLYNDIESKTNIVQEIYVIKNYVLKRLQNVDVSIAPYVQVRIKPYIIYKNKVCLICDQKSKFFYEILKCKKQTRSNMEGIFARNFRFSNTKDLWRNIYDQKLKVFKIPKIKEFNYKLLNNIVPCGQTICKFNANISNKCKLCNDIESVHHMLYGCPSINRIWKEFSVKLKCNITWKNIVCGWPSSTPSSKINCLNMILAVVTYAIFKENSYCKFNNCVYTHNNIERKIKENLLYYDVIMKQTTKNQLFEYYVKIIT